MLLIDDQLGHNQDSQISFMGDAGPNHTTEHSELKKPNLQLMTSKALEQAIPTITSKSNKAWQSELNELIPRLPTRIEHEEHVNNVVFRLGWAAWGIGVVALAVLLTVGWPAALAGVLSEGLACILVFIVMPCAISLIFFLTVGLVICASKGVSDASERLLWGRMSKWKQRALYFGEMISCAIPGVGLIAATAFSLFERRQLFYQKRELSEAFQFKRELTSAPLKNSSPDMFNEHHLVGILGKFYGAKGEEEDLQMHL